MFLSSLWRRAQSYAGEQQQSELEAALESYQTQIVYVQKRFFENDKKSKVDFDKSNLEDFYKVNRLFRFYWGTYKGKKTEGLKQYLQDAFTLECYNSHAEGSFIRALEVLDSSIRDIFETEHFLCDEIKKSDVWRWRSFSDSLINVLLERGADPNALDEDGFAPLHVMSRKWETYLRDKKYDKQYGKQSYATTCEIIKKLIEAGAIVDAEDRWRETPLSYAIWQDHSDLFKHLLAGAQVKIESDNAQKLLRDLVQKLHDEERGTKKSYQASGVCSRNPSFQDFYNIFKVLLKSGALRVDDYPVMQMIGEVIRHYIFDFHQRAEYRGCEWVSKATLEEKKKLLRLIKEHIGLNRIKLYPTLGWGDEKNPPSTYQESSAISGTHAISSDHRFCSTPRNENQYSPFSHFTLICKLHDCLIDKTDENVGCGHYCVASLYHVTKFDRECLHDRGIKIFGDGSLLMQAIIVGAGDVAAWLLENGVEINTVDFHGNIPLSLALKFGRRKIADLLLKQEACITPKVVRELCKHPGFLHISFLSLLVPPKGWNAAGSKVGQIDSLENLCGKIFQQNTHDLIELLYHPDGPRATRDVILSHVLKYAQDTEVKKLITQVPDCLERECCVNEIITLMVQRHWMYFKWLVNRMVENARGSIQIYEANKQSRPRVFETSTYNCDSLINTLKEVRSAASFEDLDDGIKRQLRNVVGDRLGLNLERALEPVLKSPNEVIRNAYLQQVWAKACFDID